MGRVEWRAALLIGWVGVALACGEDSAAEDDGGAPSGGSTPPQGSGGFAGGFASGGTGAGGLPPEMELESTYRAPVVTGRYVWSANPDSGRVAVIDPETLVVRLAEAGLEPTELAALPGGEGDRALVMNVGSEDATLLEADGESVRAVTTLPLHGDANAWAVSPSGRYAVAWSNVLLVEAPDPAEGFQDITVVDLAAGEATSFALSVGYRPSQISFDDDEQRAFVVTEPGLSVIELAGAPQVSGLIELTADPIADPASRDVSITPDGALALVRVEGQSQVGLVDLSSGERSTIDFAQAVTDLDLAEDGERAFVVAGSELYVMPVPPAGTDVASLPQVSFVGETLRSVSPGAAGEFAVLYSNAVDNSHVGAFTAGPGFEGVEKRVVDVKAPVISALASPSGRHAIVLGKTPPQSAKLGAFAIVPAQMDRVVKVVGTDAEPRFLTFSPDGEHAVLAIRDDLGSVHGAYLVELENLAETFVPLASPPLSVGIVAARKRAFVSQLHPEGRITFLDLSNGSAHTLTGFELAAKVSGQ